MGVGIYGVWIEFRRDFRIFGWLFFKEFSFSVFAMVVKGFILGIWDV